MSEQVAPLIEESKRLARERYADALVLLIEAQVRARKAGDPRMLVLAVATEARLALRHRPVEFVLHTLSEALRIAQASGDAGALFEAHFSLAQTWTDLRMPDRALRALDKAEAFLGTEAAERHRGWGALQASVMSQSGRVAEADALYARLLRHFEEHPDTVQHGTMLHNMATHLDRCGRLEQALAVSEESERVLRTAGAIEPGTRGAIVAVRMRLLVKLGRATEALALLQEWFPEPPTGSPWACAVWMYTAEARLALGDMPGAEAANQAALDMALRLNIPRTRDILEQAARLSTALGRETRALQLNERAQEEEQRFERLALSVAA